MEVFEINPATSVNFAPASELEEVLQNVATLLGTLRYTVPYDRLLGIDASFLDSPTPVAEARLSAEVIKLIREREPRAQVVEFKFKRDSQEGILIPTVKVGVNVD